MFNIDHKPVSPPVLERYVDPDHFGEEADRAQQRFADGVIPVLRDMTD